MKNVVFLGSKDIGYECIEYLFLNQQKLNFNLSGVLTPAREQKIIKYCKVNSIQIFDSLDGFIDYNGCDIGISVQYHEILKKKHIFKAKELFVNLHMAPLPEYRGCNQFSFAIINKDKMFGTTIHRLEEGIDSGAIIFENRFNIPDGCWINELYNITFKKSINLFIKSFPKLLSGDYTLKNNLII